jgi:hypothetical protein
MVFGCLEVQVLGCVTAAACRWCPAACEAWQLELLPRTMRGPPRGSTG